MHRRGPAAAVAALVLALVMLLAPASTTATVVAAPPDTEVPTTAASSQPVPTVSDFFPEDNNLSDCLGFVERPGCGSEARGGLGQTLVFVALAGGLALIFWRISVGVRKNRRA